MALTEEEKKALITYRIEKVDDVYIEAVDNGKLTTMERCMQHRTELLLGQENRERLQKARVIIFGVGGVGSWCAEALVRSGIREITIVDSDRVSVTNCNRQLMATSKTIGQVKVEALRERLQEINPDAHIVACQKIYSAESADEFQLGEYDYIVDAIDSLRDKADLILRATALPSHITLVSSMGAALRRDPFQIRKAEFWKVKGDPLARALRHKFKGQKMWPARKFQCVYSEEPPMQNLGAEPTSEIEDCTNKAQINGSLCHITASFGMAIAGIIINQIIENNNI